MTRLVLANQNQANAVTNNLRLDKDLSSHTFYLASFSGRRNSLKISAYENNDLFVEKWSS